MSNIDKLLEIMAALRNKDGGCPWDLEQTFTTIAPYTVEEAYEVADAISRNDMRDLRDELGDLLLQVVFHAQMASEAGEFDFDEVAGSIADKMQRRHPHVFGSAEEISAGIREGSWEAIKAGERAGVGDDSAIAGVALALPALMRAQKLGERAAATGFDWDGPSGVRQKIEEELDELGEAVGSRDRAHVHEEFGDLLFSIANLARHLGVDPETTLAAANAKFERRFREMERAVLAEGHRLSELPAAELDQAWRTAKRHLSGES